MVEIRQISVNLLRLNEGQVEGVPANPRSVRKERFEALKKSLTECPEMLNYRPLIGYPYGEGEILVIAGNMRLRAAQSLGWAAIPCIVLDKDADPRLLREIAIKDNLPYGETDWDILANNWELDELRGWGVELPVFGNAPAFADNIRKYEGSPNEDKIDTNAEEGKKRGWTKYTGTSDEKVTDLKENIKIYKRKDRYYIALYQVNDKEGIPISRVKTEEFVQMFAEAVSRIAGGLIFHGGGGTCIVTAPKRRHTDFNFAEAVCGIVASALNIPFYVGLIEARTKQRINPDFTLKREITESNILFFDDIFTTGSTYDSCMKLFEGKNVLSIIGIQNHTFKE